MNKNLKIALYLTVASVFTSPLYAQDSPPLAVFGDSLSDPGNYFALYKDLEIQPFEASPSGTAFIPSSPYAIGGKHFTNGNTWIEQLAVMLGDPVSGSPAVQAPGTFTNYAVGRSRARSNPLGVFNDVNLDTQVQAFLDDYDGNAPQNTTYVIWIGNNDVADALLSGQLGLIGSALANIQANIQALYDQGARKFLVVNVPNLGSTPRVQQLAILLQDPTIPFLAGLVSSQFNLGLVGVLQGLALHPNYNQIQFQVLDAFALLDAVIAQPDQHGFEVVNESCVISDAQGKSHCNKPATYLFWDGQHPTTAAHGIFAEAAYDLLTQ